MSKKITFHGITLVLVSSEITPFSYMNRIFIPDGKYTDQDLTSVIEHERSHLKQYHLLDIMMIEMVIVFLWFNPFVWFYERSLKEVHEYLADDAVLKKGIPQGRYQALLVNEAVGGPVFTMSNQFNQSLIKKRIVMMTKMKTSEKAKLKTLLFVPLIALLLVAFASPQKLDKPSVKLISEENKNLQAQEIVVNGKVTEKRTGEPVPGVHVTIAGTMIGTQTDLSGNYSIKAKSSKSVLVYSFIGYKTVEEPIENKKSFNVQLETEVHTIDFSKKNYMEAPNMKDGKKENTKAANGEPVFVAVEEMPSYPGGTNALREFIKTNLRYPEAAKKAKVEGTVMVTFDITAQGKIKDSKIVNSANQLLDQEALRIVSLFTNWNPGKQNGKPVKFMVNVPVEFKL